MLSVEQLRQKPFLAVGLVVGDDSPEARKKHAITARKNAFAQHNWKLSEQPAWLTEKFYAGQVQPRLTKLSVSAIARHISVSRW